MGVQFSRAMSVRAEIVMAASQYDFDKIEDPQNNWVMIPYL